jgi:hypothetical protein
MGTERCPMEWEDTRTVLNSILWALGTGAQWRIAEQISSVPDPAIAASSSGCGKAGNPLGVPRRKLFRHGAPRLHANLAQTFMSVYSYRNATMGSTFEARRAGK